MKRNGFSLVELSIVLVIIGLLVGGVMMGSSLIRSSEIKTVYTESAKYKQVAVDFRNKYAAKPGDMNDATSYWSGVTNGDGNGEVEFQTGAGAAGANLAEEFAQYWVHLQKAGLIEEQLSGLSGSGSASHMVVGTNIPNATLPKAGWGAWTMGNVTGTASLYTYDCGDVLTLGGDAGAFNSWNFSGNILNPAEAWSIDTKIDDGMPGAGKIIVTNYTLCADGTSQTDYAANYRVDATSNGCSLIFTHIMD